MIKTLAVVIIYALVSMNTIDAKKVKEGCYFNTYGHSTVIIEITSNKVRFYGDNSRKSYKEGSYEINTSNSIITINYNTICSSKSYDESSLIYGSTHKLKWDPKEGSFKLDGFEYQPKSQMLKDIKKRVKSNCKFTYKK